MSVEAGYSISKAESLDQPPFSEEVLTCALPFLATRLAEIKP